MRFNPIGHKRGNEPVCWNRFAGKFQTHEEWPTQDEIDLLEAQEEVEQLLAHDKGAQE